MCHSALDAESIKNKWIPDQVWDDMINMDLTNKDQLIQYLKQHGLWAKKSMGQNFLIDRAALDKIVEAAELSPADTVLEIGPGVGTLTEELVQKAGRVVAIEKDEKLAELLTQKLKPPAQGSLREKTQNQKYGRKL